MGSIPMLDQTPPQPPGVSSQMGASPYAGVASMLGQQQKPPEANAAGPANPRGALITMKDAIGKVLDQMSKMEPGFGPFADRIKTLLDTGVGSIMSGGSPSPQSQPTVMSPAQSLRPGEGGASAPGAGFPG